MALITVITSYVQLSIIQHEILFHFDYRSCSSIFSLATWYTKLHHGNCQLSPWTVESLGGLQKQRNTSRFHSTTREVIAHRMQMRRCDSGTVRKGSTVSVDSHYYWNTRFLLSRVKKMSYTRNLSLQYPFTAIY